ncbi:hypothetical protein R1flu_022388 [Riccia fluitans]|uniref:Uncharacterized protein n=1 Tax=Riccia fluitans TaxID=41844 RepID=A0ABD1ZSZ0_9MARC
MLGIAGEVTFSMDSCQTEESKDQLNFIIVSSILLNPTCISYAVSNLEMHELKPTLMGNLDPWLPFVTSYEFVHLQFNKGYEVLPTS